MAKRSGGRPSISDTAFIAFDNELLTPLYGIIQEASLGDNEVVAAPAATRKIRVLAYNFTSAGAVNAKFRSGTTDITGLTYMDAAGKGKVAPFNPMGWFECAAGEALNMNLSAAVAVGGELTYVLVPTDEPSS